ncbi:hypothetical protein DL93DRAFT_2053649, partial [Clavulina sp. PMI_390]
MDEQDILSRTSAQKPSGAVPIELKFLTDINALGNVSTWSTRELRDRRRFVRLSCLQTGSIFELGMAPVKRQEALENDREIINCIAIPGCGDEPYITSVDIIKTMELLINPPTKRMTIEEKNRARRNIDTLRPTTLKKGNESLHWMWELRSPRPFTISKEVKIFKWSNLEPALTKIMKKY